MLNTRELSDYVSRNFNHNYSNLADAIWRTLDKNEFFLKLNVRSGICNYWTIDLDYDFSHCAPLNKFDALTINSIPSKCKIVKNLDENLQTDTDDPFLNKHSIFLSKWPKKLIHQTTMVVVLIIKVFQESDKTDLTIIKITNRVNNFLGNSYDSFLLRNKLLKLIKSSKYFVGSIKPQYKNQHWRLNPEYEFAEVQGGIDLQVKLNQITNAEALLHEAIFQDHNIAGNVMITKLNLLAILKSSNQRPCKRDITKFIRENLGFNSSNLDYLISDSLTKNEFFKRIDIISFNSYHWTIDSKILLDETQPNSITKTDANDNSYLNNSSPENVEMEIHSQKRSLNSFSINSESNMPLKRSISISESIVNKKLALSTDYTKRKALQSIENRVGMLTCRKASDNKENI